MARRVTTALMVIAFVLTLTWPLELWNKPSSRTPLSVRKTFASRLLCHTGAILVCLVGAGVGASFYVRQARAQYRQEAIRNLRTLVEGEDPGEE